MTKLIIIIAVIAIFAGLVYIEYGAEITDAVGKAKATAESLSASADCLNSTLDSQQAADVCSDVYKIQQ